MLRTSLIFVAMCVVAGALWLATRQHPNVPDDPVPVAEELRSEPPPATRGSAAVPEAGIVRILVREQVAAAADGEGRLVAELQHVGPLSNERIDAFVGSFHKEQQRYEFLLANREVDAADAAALLKEADLLLMAARFAASEQALLQGDYVVTDASTPVPMQLPGAEVVQIATSREGADVTLSIVMPLQRYPRLADALSYRKAIHEFQDSERARRFNALPDAERSALARRIAAIQANPEATDEQRQFVYETI
ncbi:MAG: hypothetical protein KAI24_02380, partial [Planctomycetes bacterium]|nr:hypothetical protein [Planctomycetota bacterium]